MSAVLVAVGTTLTTIYFLSKTPIPVDNIPTGTPVGGYQKGFPPGRQPNPYVPRQNPRIDFDADEPEWRKERKREINRNLFNYNAKRK